MLTPDRYAISVNFFIESYEQIGWALPTLPGCLLSILLVLFFFSLVIVGVCASTQPTTELSHTASSAV